MALLGVALSLDGFVYLRIVVVVNGVNIIFQAQLIAKNWRCVYCCFLQWPQSALHDK